jgi:lysyl-tRNA synthetase class 2
MERSEFLKQIWTPYPLLPPGVSFFGRLQELRRGSGWEVTLEREGQSRQRSFAKLDLASLADTDLPEVLEAGDLLGISEEGHVILLAPQLQKLPPRRLDVDTLLMWQEYLHRVREFFRQHSFLEIATPSLVTCPGTEPSLDYFRTELVRGSKRETLYLPTSPELHLKKALALGAENIFEIRNCFRNGEVTGHHQPEFTMIEWYRAYAPLSAIKKDVVELIAYLTEQMPHLHGPHGRNEFTLSSLFKTHCDFDLQPDTGVDQLKALAESLGVDVSSATQIDDYFFLIFLEKIETRLPADRLNFVEKYPPYQAALARLTADGWGDRMEVYWQGLEIANAFHELNDPVVQRRRFAEDLAKKKLLKKEEIPLDEEFLRCLEAGMPPSSGIALGLERLFMALTGIKNIAETRLFPVAAN